ncbi:L-asparaginase [Pseudoclavibacter endophyticus]|uniref:asparaginase n=1 Tax=Pseudoclavibacter endophyticus TaxID=1778590 RepID=A0A6H9WEY4_9MICO|nr:asparaginase [Pseudoclavibacter endophyticus]KAB1649472.1 asparaginase [Pseudoclavibacter endophyticus]GGA62359.1 L-asparaginase [Pseudoclavibacter endophyticus]
MAHLVLLGTGGTIASRRTESGDSRAGDSSAALLATVDGAASDVTIEGRDVLSVNSFNLGFGDLRAIADAVAESLARDDVDGVVVTHGTDTLEETAAFLDAVHDDERPVVLTGAQRGADVPDTDGPRNLRDAFAVAADPSSRGRGVLAVFAGEIFAATGLRKADTVAPQPFASITGGCIGRVLERPTYFSTPQRAEPVERPGESIDDLRVDVVTAYPGADGALLDAAVAAGARGAVVLGTGAGNPGAALTAAIERAVAADVVVLLGSRTGSGPSLPIYGGGGAADAVAAGALTLGEIPATQARVLLALALAGPGGGDAHAVGARLRERGLITSPPA